jgi:hypothetical protein
MELVDLCDHIIALLTSLKLLHDNIIALATLLWKFKRSVLEMEVMQAVVQEPDSLELVPDLADLRLELEGFKFDAYSKLDKGGIVSIFPENAIAHTLKKTVLEGSDICVEYIDHESVHIIEGTKLHLVELVEHFLNAFEQSVESSHFSGSIFHRIKN